MTKNHYSFEQLARHFEKPQYIFGGLMCDLSPEQQYQDATVVFWDLPFELTSTGGRTSRHGPEAVRYVSAKHIEYDLSVPVCDLGTFGIDIPAEVERQMTNAIARHDAELTGLPPGLLRTIDDYMNKLDSIVDVNQTIYGNGKISFPFIGEHYPTVLLVRAIVQARCKSNPRLLKVVHIDAHRDMKESYLGMRRCHTTPFYEILEDVPGENLVQIAIRQASSDEHENAERNGVHTFDWRSIHDNFDNVLQFLRDFTDKADVYFSMDIDGLSSEFTPSTGTPVPFGLTPYQALELMESISPTAQLVGADIAEVGYRNNGDYREAVTAWMLAQHMLRQKYVKPLTSQFQNRRKTK